MHVVHVGKYYLPYRGGIETVVDELCRGMVRAGCQVTAVVSNDGPTTIRDEIDGVTVLRLARAAVLSSQPLNVGLLHAIKSAGGDVVHFHTPNPLGALALLSARPRAPIVVTHHSDVVRQKVLGVAAVGAHALLYAASAALVAPTPKHIEHSALLSRFRRKTEVIHLPLDPEPFRRASASWDAALPSSWQDSPLALFVGRLVYYKGLDVLLAALQRSPRLRLAIVGTGVLEADLRAAVERLGVGTRVVFLGGVSDERLRALYKRATCFVLPSTAPSEAFGMVQLEAMSAACPVVSTDLKSGVPYVNVNGQTGLVVPPGDVSALAAAIERVVSEPGLAARFGAAGAKRVEAFQTDHVVAQHLELYGRLTQRAAARPRR